MVKPAKIYRPIHTQSSSKGSQLLWNNTCRCIDNVTGFMCAERVTGAGFMKILRKTYIFKSIIIIHNAVVHECSSKQARSSDRCTALWNVGEWFSLITFPLCNLLNLVNFDLAPLSSEEIGLRTTLYIVIWNVIWSNTQDDWIGFRRY